MLSFELALEFLEYFFERNPAIHYNSSQKNGFL